MATYTSPESKEWTLDDKAGFAEGTRAGAEIENPIYPNKIVLECLLGTNQLGPTVKDWNPGFEEQHPTELWRPNHWKFEDPSTGSTYVQEAEEPFEGDDHVNLADEGEQGRVIHKTGKLILDPEDAPEIRNNRHGPAHELGPAAGLYLAQLLNGATVRLETGVRERDHYGRVLAYVYHADTFINLEMVRAGYAVTSTVPPDVAHADDFLEAEREARAEGRGLWTDKD